MINDEYTSIKNWTNQPLQPGTIVQLIDDTWFPSLLPDNSPNKTWEPYLYVITNGHDYREEIAYDYNFPAPVQFKLIRMFCFFFYPSLLPLLRSYGFFYYYHHYSLLGKKILF